MRLARLPLAGLAGALAACMGLVAANASAMTCYIKYDRNDNVVYRDSRPPLDLCTWARRTSLLTTPTT